MKRIILFLLVILTSNGWLLANHWTPVITPYESNMTLTGIVQINGVEQQSSTLEVGAFCGTECRGSGILAYFVPTQHYVIQMLVYGEAGDPLTFKLFDHSLNQELDLVSPDGVIFSDNGYGSLNNPFVLNFVTIHDITVSANPIMGGTVSGAGTYAQGTTATLVATPNEGYTFINWTQGSEVVSNLPTYSLTVTSAASYVANFSNNHWVPNSAAYESNMTLTGIIQINNVEQQSVTFEVGAFCSDECRGTAKPVYFAPTQHYIVQLVIYGEVGDQLIFKLFDHNANEELELTSPDAITFTTDGYGSLVNPYVLNFLEIHEITVVANPADGGIVEGSGIYNHFETCTLTATANDGCYFVNWTLGGEVVSNSPTYSFEVTGAADYVANFELTTITQATTFTMGWNWWSTYIEADDLFAQLKTGLGANAQQIKSSTTFVSYFNGMWVGGLNGISNESCYLINANNACTLEMTGNPATPANHPITINPNWNWIGYPNTGAQSVANAFSNFTPANGDQVKSQNAFATYYGGMWVGGLNNITPGMGLLYKSNSTETKTLIYSEVNRSEELAENVTNEDNHWTADYHAYPSNMTVMAVIELDDVELQGEHYEIAAFANEECRGNAKLMYVAPINRYVAFLTIVGDEASELRFSLYDSETGVVETQDVASLLYETNAIVGSLETPYVIRFRSTAGMYEWADNLNIFPNPVNRGERFSLCMAEETGMVQVEIVNALGVVVQTQNLASPQSIAAPMATGVFTLRITVEGKGVCYRKLVVK